MPPWFSHSVAIVRDALYHCEAGSNSTKRLDPGGIEPEVKSSIKGICGTVETQSQLGLKRTSGFRCVWVYSWCEHPNLNRSVLCVGLMVNGNVKEARPEESETAERRFPALRG